ncbi:hypothetical protein DYH55_15095 [Methylovirgula sp. 4M-Z18]|nr:hypothetical protein DYH55_15095 [Methylovirgula sp. 4M-Z18]
MALAGGLATLSAGSARAQFYRYDDGYGPPVYRGYNDDRYDDQRSSSLRPRQVLQLLEDQGYRPAGPIFRNGDVFVVNVINPEGVQQRVIVDAYQGDILQTHGIARPVPPSDIPNATDASRNPEFDEQAPELPVTPTPRVTKAVPPSASLPAREPVKPRVSEKEEVAKSVLSPIAPLKPPAKPIATPKPVAPKEPVANEAKTKPAVPPVAAVPPAAAPASVTPLAPAPVAPTAEAPKPAPEPAPIAAANPPAAAPAPTPTAEQAPPAKPEPPKKAPGPLNDVPVAPLE